MRTTRKILCIGTDATLLESRCSVLAYSGYQAESTTLPADYQRMRTGKYDLVIVSASLQEAQSRVFTAALPAETQVLILEGLVLPGKLLAVVAEKLALLRGDADPSEKRLYLAS